MGSHVGPALWRVRRRADDRLRRDEIGDCVKWRRNRAVARSRPAKLLPYVFELRPYDPNAEELSWRRFNWHAE
jgi:hypothetical protein